MINVKECRQDFLSILKAVITLNDKNSANQILQKIKKLNNYIKNDYFYDIELPQICHRMLDNLLQDTEQLDLNINKYYLSQYYNLPKQAQQEKSDLIKLAKVLLDKYTTKKVYYKNTNKQTLLNSLLQKYKRIFGAELVNKSFQEGLNILENKNNNLFKPKSDFEQSIYNNSQVQYPTAVIEKYLCKSLISNIIFETKNIDIDTHKLIEIVNKLKRGEL